MLIHQPHGSDSRVTSGGFGLALAVVLAAVFVAGVALGYNSVYRNISVALFSPPPAASHF
jgi:hypothetical protein